MSRNKQKQIWSDPEFVRRLKVIKAKRELAGNPVDNLGELTREIAISPMFDKLEEELLNIDCKIRLKLDNKRLFK